MPRSRKPTRFVFVGAAPSHLASGRPVADGDVIRAADLALDTQDGPGADQELVDRGDLLPTTQKA